jgi:hypothetical protein
MKKIIVFDAKGKVVKTKYLFKSITTGTLKSFTASLPQWWAAYYIPYKNVRIYYTRWKGLEPYLFVRDSYKKI